MFNKQMEVERYKEDLWFNSIYIEHNFINKFTYVQQGIIMKLEHTEKGSMSWNYQK